MKFEELVDKTRTIKAPDLKFNDSGKMNEASNRKSVVEQLKWTDARTRWGIRAIQGIYVFLILILTAILILSKTTAIEWGVGFILLAFILIIVVQQLRFQKYNYSYSDKPVLDFLVDAKKRMRVFTPRTWMTLPIWVFIDTGICFIISVLLPEKQYIPHAIIVLQVILLFLISLDFYSAYRYWKKEHYPAIIEIDRMLAEIETSYED